MKSEKKTGKRGRPRKNPIKPVETGPKRKRGRPPKMEGGRQNKTDVVARPIVEEYVEPKILRKKRVFTFDKNIFHTLSKKFNGDIIKISYVINEIMKLYTLNKIDINYKSYSNEFYSEWCKGSPPIEPLIITEISQSQAVYRGIPLQYKYPIIIDEKVWTSFEKSSRIYTQFLINKLVQMYLDEKNSKLFISIDVNKAQGWCNIENK